MALQLYPNKFAANTLLKGFTEGFSLHFNGPRIPCEARNLKSARENIFICREKIQKEIEAGRVCGPFTIPPISTLRVSPIGLVPKKCSNDFRLIHHLSYPEGMSVNDHIPQNLCSVDYTRFDEAVQMVQGLGRGCLMAKTDIKSAFRLLPVHPSDFDLLGFKLGNQYFFDKSLPFGCSISCAHFERFSTFLNWYAIHNSHNTQILHYLDDFLICGPPGSIICSQTLAKFKQMCEHLGVPIAEEKTEGPTTSLCFLGLDIDTDNMLVKFPSDKIAELRDKLRTMLSKRKATLKEMQSLIGSLNFACRAIKPGRAFCRRLIDSTCHVSKPHHFIKITEGMQEDMRMWLQFFESYNGISVFQDSVWVRDSYLNLFTDAAGSRGFGAYFNGRWFAGQWPNAWHILGITKDITFLELFPIVAAILLWGHIIANKKIFIQTDNQAVVSIINKQSAKSPRVMRLIRLFVLYLLKYNISVKASHIPGCKNLIADCLSRFQFGRFRRLAPNSRVHPDQVPQEMWDCFG